MQSTKQRPHRVAPLPEHLSRADEVDAQLKHDIGEFSPVPGARFRETEVSERLGVSRTSVRQARLP